jgi:hypothetical protein
LADLIQSLSTAVTKNRGTKVLVLQWIPDLVDLVT